MMTRDMMFKSGDIVGTAKPLQKAVEISVLHNYSGTGLYITLMDVITIRKFGHVYLQVLTSIIT